MTSTSSVVTTTGDPARVEVNVPLRAEFASIVRLVAASLGADAGFSVDDIDDLRLAISEVFASVVDARADARVAVSFETSGQAIAVTVSPVDLVDGVDDGTPETAGGIHLDDLARSIIGVAVDEFEIIGATARIVKFGSAVQTTDQPAP